MTTKRLLSRNAHGVETWFHGDGNTIQIETRQDVRPILELNKKLRNEFQGYKDKGDHHFHHYATIPAVVITKWLNEYGVDVFDPEHEDRVAKLLNDPDWRHLRTTEGWV